MNIEESLCTPPSSRRSSLPDPWSGCHARVLGVGHRPEDVLRALCESPKQEDAFHLCDLDVVAGRHRLWRKSLPRVLPYYSVKACDTEMVLRTLAALGTGFGCASKAEIKKVLNLGIDPSRVIHAHSAKPASHVRYAAHSGVRLTTFDSEDELHKLKKLHPTCKLLLRINSNAEGSLPRMGDKFGCCPETDASRLLRLAKSLGLRVAGVCFHVGSGSGRFKPDAFRRAFRIASRICSVGRELGMAMDVLDIGGGFPGHDDAEFGRMAEAVNDSIDEYFPSDEQLTVIAEPGRFFVSAAFTLAANVYSRRILRDETGRISNVMYFINAGIHNGFNPAANWHPTGKPLSQKIDDGVLLPSSVWGPTCDGSDEIESSTELPLLEVGSWLTYRHMGAYTLTCSTKFNGFPLLQVHCVVSKKTMLTLRDRLAFSADCFYF